MQFCNQHAVIDEDLNSKKKYNSNNKETLKQFFKNFFFTIIKRYICKYTDDTL